MLFKASAQSMLIKLLVYCTYNYDDENVRNVIKLNAWTSVEGPGGSSKTRDCINTMGKLDLYVTMFRDSLN